MSMSIISIRLVYAHKNEPVAQIQLLDYVENNYNGRRRAFIAGRRRGFLRTMPLCGMQGEPGILMIYSMI